MHDAVSPRLAAAALAVSESSLKRWADQGHLALVKTQGGHRRVKVAGLLEFARAHGYPIERPEMLGLPPGQTRGRPTLKPAVDELVARLVSGDEPWVRRTLIGAYAAGADLAELVDNSLAPAFAQLGHAWERGALEIYEEHRATEIALRSIAELRGLVPDPAPDAPKAFGATLEGDWYTLPLAAADLTLRALGFATTSLGAHLPARSLATAIASHRPRLVFLSLSQVSDAERLASDVNTTFEATSQVGAALVIGGGATQDPSLCARLRFTARCETLARLRDLAGPLLPPTELTPSRV
jgi:MerR family transcriptional regulator, light-induced transcriptional regulator